MSEEVCSFPNQDTVRLREGLHRILLAVFTLLSKNTQIFF